MGNKLNIIGAGIAGLCTGCYLQMNGYDTEIFELHDKPGGLCTSWKRNGYVIVGRSVIDSIDQRYGDIRAKVETL